MGGNAIGMADIEVRITNSTNRTQSYMVTVRSTTLPATA
jgi:hypothetical protein